MPAARLLPVEVTRTVGVSYHVIEAEQGGAQIRHATADSEGGVEQMCPQHTIDAEQPGHRYRMILTATAISVVAGPVFMSVAEWMGL